MDVVKLLQQFSIIIIICCNYSVYVHKVHTNYMHVINLYTWLFCCELSPGPFLLYGSLGIQTYTSIQCVHVGPGEFFIRNFFVALLYEND